MYEPGGDPPGRVEQHPGSRPLGGGSASFLFNGTGDAQTLTCA